MTNESQDPRDSAESLRSAGESARGATRWLTVAAVVLLIIYPAGRWLMIRGRGASPAETAALQASIRQYQAGHLQEAIDLARVALAANPHSAEAYNNIAVAHLELRQYDEAIQAAQEALRIQPTFQLAKNNLAWIQQEKARASTPPISAGQPSRADVLLNQSLQDARTGRFKECMAAATEAAKLNPRSAAAFNNLGFCAGNLHLWDEAIRDTEEALRLDPSFELARNNLAWMKMEKGKTAGSKSK